MLEYTPSPYVTWIKHLSDYRIDSDVLVEKDEGLEIIVHPGHKSLCVPHAGSLYEVIDKEDKTIQLYFYSIAWVIPVLIQGDEEKIAAALGLVGNIVDIAPEEERSDVWNMLWDDHAVCERLCVIIELLSNDLPSLSSSEDKLGRHLEKTYQYIEKLVASDRWLNNNHRLFHLLAAFVYHHHKGDSGKVEEFVSYISDFCHNLIDVETGFAREQCISYCFFDINVVEKVIKALSGLSVGVDFDVHAAHRNLLSHVNALAFPDHTLPASGDTPCGLKLSDFQKKHRVPEIELHEHWRRLEKLGFYRGESESKDVQFLMLEHNGESGHGHHSPLHMDVWFANFGPVLVDCGGPYKYGNSERYNWFRASRGHNSLSISGVDFSSCSKFRILMKPCRSQIVGFVDYGDSVHSRVVCSARSKFFINEFVSSEKPWMIYYNFASNLVIADLDVDAKSLVLESASGEKLSVTICSNELDIEIEDTKRCVGHASADYGPSLIVSAPAGMYSYLFKIIRMEY